MEQVVKGEGAVHEDHDLAVEHEARLRQRAQRVDQLGKVTAQRLTGLGLEQHLRARAERETTESVPLRLVEPAFPRW